MLDLFLQNTFQVVLASDGESSYTLFLYDVLQWSQADLRVGSGGSSGSGLSGSGLSGSGSGLDSRYVWSCCKEPGFLVGMSENKLLPINHGVHCTSHVVRPLKYRKSLAYETAWL